MSDCWKPGVVLQLIIVCHCDGHGFKTFDMVSFYFTFFYS